MPSAPLLHKPSHPLTPVSQVSSMSMNFMHLPPGRYPLFLISGLRLRSYPGRDLNPHDLIGHRILSPACLPVSPPGPALSGKRDSNSRPRPWQGRALPTELFPQTRFKEQNRAFRYLHLVNPPVGGENHGWFTPMGPKDCKYSMKSQFTIPKLSEDSRPVRLNNWVHSADNPGYRTTRCTKWYC